MDALVKKYLSYEEQLNLLADRGMDTGDPNEALNLLRQINYYRLSGYWYPFRQQVDQQRQDEFYSGTTLADVRALYDFDARLRVTTFSELSRIELVIRALLGRINPLIHHEKHLLLPTISDDDYSN